MGIQTHVLIDASGSPAAEAAEFYGSRSADSKWHARLRTCRGGRSDGVQVVELNNGAMCIDVLPTRGMGIWRVRRGGKTLGWQAPAGGPVHPAFVRLTEPAGLGWLDGFSELLCRCGLESNGPPEFDDAGRLLRPLHGRIANTPAHGVELLVDEDSGQLSLRGLVDETRFHFQSLRLTSTVATSFGSDEFTWTDEVENFGGRDAVLQMLYHFNIGQPLLKPGARIMAPLGSVAPLTQVAAREGVETWNIMPPPRLGSAEQVYVLDLAADATGNTQVLVSGLAEDEGLGLQFNKAALPCFTVWRNSPAEVDGYVLGIEPGTNYPNARTFEQSQGRVIELKPGEKWRAEVTASWHADSQSIAKAEKAIESIQANHKPELLTNPKREWSASAHLLS
jgi:hypothetical protein